MKTMLFDWYSLPADSTWPPRPLVSIYIRPRSQGSTPRELGNRPNKWEQCFSIDIPYLQTQHGPRDLLSVYIFAHDHKALHPGSLEISGTNCSLGFRTSVSGPGQDLGFGTWTDKQMNTDGQTKPVLLVLGRGSHGSAGFGKGITDRLRQDDEVAESVTYIFAGRRKLHDI
jgi:hypothetical protein